MLPGNPALKLLLAHQGLHLERSRCVQHRFRPAGCSRCFDICPSGAIRWTDDGLHWEQDDCQRCLLCVAICPTGALAGKELPFVQTLKKLATEQQPVLACSGRPSTIGHARLPCLGLLTSPELLLVTSLALGRSFQLNLTECSACPNAAILPHLKLAAEQIAEIVDHAILVEQHAELTFRETTVNRREFFGMLRRQSKVAAYSLAEALQELPERSFGDKSLPARRLLLLQLMKRLPEDQRSELSALIFPKIEISEDSCTSCKGCVGVCPTGALMPPVSSGAPPRVHEQSCTECGLCTAFCRSGSIRIQSSEKLLLSYQR